MTPGRIATDHKITGCRSRAIHQIDRAVEFLKLVSPVIPAGDEDPSRQFLYQSTILMLQSFYEEYLRCVVALGTYWKAPAVRLHLAEGQDDPEQFAVMSMAEVARFAQELVRFENRGKKLKAIIELITGSGPFPTAVIEQRCLDFAIVRNLIAHRGGLPLSVTAPIATLPTLKIESQQIGNIDSQKLRTVSGQFVMDGVAAMGESIVSIETAMLRDKDLRLALPD